MEKDYYLEQYLSLLKSAKEKLSIPVIASINCSDLSTWQEYVSSFEKAGADGFELNYYPLAQDRNVSGEDVDKALFRFAKKIRKSTSLPVSIKLGYKYSSTANIIAELDKIGINALVLFNRFFRPDIDIEKEAMTHSQPLSGADEYAESLRWIALMSNEVKCDLAASTGVHSGETAIKLLLAGAAAVLICVFGSYRLYRMINLYPLSITTESYKTHCIREILSQSSLFGGIDPAGISAKTGDFLYQTAYVQTSYLLVYLASHVGLWIYPAVILLTAGFSFFAVRWCLRQSSMFSRLISLSIISVLIVQWVLYIAVNLGVFNGFTLPLPFLSHGNVSFVVNMALAGLLFCVSGTGWLYSDEPRRAKALKDGIPSAAE